MPCCLPSKGFCFLGNYFGCHTVSFALREYLFLSAEKKGYVLLSIE